MRSPAPGAAAELARAAYPGRRRDRLDREAVLRGGDCVLEERRRGPAGRTARRARPSRRPRRARSPTAGPLSATGSRAIGAERGRARRRRARAGGSPSQTSANASPPMPVDIGSVTQRIAAAARAASAAFPPRSSARRPARVASGWLVATIASRGDSGWARRGELERHAAGSIAPPWPVRPSSSCTRSRSTPRMWDGIRASVEEAGYEVARPRPARAGARARLRGLGAAACSAWSTVHVRPGRLLDGRLSLLRALAAGS